MPIADYLTAVQSVSRRDISIECAINTLTRHNLLKKFDAIAVCGVSGLTFGSMLAYELGKELIVVRKKCDKNAHSFNRVEGNPFLSVLIVDDLVCSGKTLKYIVDMLNSVETIGKPTYTNEYTYLYFDRMLKKTKDLIR